jgi:RecJ-like exonuclease
MGICENCWGMGEITEVGEHLCYRCFGAGYIVKTGLGPNERLSRYGMARSVRMVKCLRCQGVGTVITRRMRPCPYCGGTGRSVE